jgi:hypothetical protein
MPSDLTRPLAGVSMGDIVILALRMGMQWRVWDLESSKIKADGNGFNLTGSEAMGLGIILRLTATGQHVKHRKLIPTRAVDKMLLDILPGDRVLVGQDFPLVTKDFDMQPLPDSQGILVAMMSRENREKMTKLDSQVVRVDVITLLLSYLPLKGCIMTRYCFPGWSTERGYRSVYTFWEGRLEYPDDWYIRLGRKRVSRDQTDASSKKEYMQDVKEVFAWTQTWLKAQFNYEVYEIRKHYIEHLHHDEHGIHAYLAENHTSVPADESEAAWWVMQLRGMAWHFSTWHGGTMVRDVLGEQFIPSSFYENKSPV